MIETQNPIFSPAITEFQVGDEENNLMVCVSCADTGKPLFMTSDYDAACFIVNLLVSAQLYENFPSFFRPALDDFSDKDEAGL